MMTGRERPAAIIEASDYVTELFHAHAPLNGESRPGKAWNFKPRTILHIISIYYKQVS
jgi:hypothetical protein